MRKRMPLVTVGMLSLASVLFYAARKQPANPTNSPRPGREPPAIGASIGSTARDDAPKAKQAASAGADRAAQLRKAIAALALVPSSSVEVARRELELLGLQRVESVTALLRAPQASKERDPVTLSHADELVVSYARERKQILAEMYDSYLKRGALYDPSEHLAALEDAAADFAAEARQLETQIPGVAVLGEMLEATSLKRPAFLDELHAGEDGV